ncbi:MAG: hypothetical protein KAW81_02765, partial [Dehalococcoidia bacterium]|nr:hypothetical protein [Dehalococcoidia bacterium]
MNLSCLLSLVKPVPVYKQLKGNLLSPQDGENKLVAPDAVKPYVIAALYQELSLPILVVIGQPENAKRLYDQLEAWCP